ncbi:ATP-binding protein [Weissella viridescens]|uniref:ATP-binding protein n=1 Tax=Weissella viridescens TaxID=1629 RepID=A0A3P2RCD9_WEIVI|nr:ATP-binding protein [Weissella viridescens]RRG18254.1 ATP-binding protein [Weissella viridescens]
MTLSEEQLRQFISTPEDEFHDFKEMWYGPQENTELIKDIFSFANTAHHKDCYLIIGVSDDGKCVGVSDDPNRKNQQMIIDMIRGTPIAGEVIPKIRMDTFAIDDNEIDVITIHDIDNLPIFLDSDYPKHPKGNKVIHAGQIFVRNYDVNTPINGTASFDQTEMLWRKRMGMDLPIKARYGKILDDVTNWKYFENRNWENGYIYTLDPDFIIELREDDTSRDQAAAYSLKQFRTKMSWRWIDLKYRGTVIESFLGVFVDGTRAFYVTPNIGFVKGLGSYPHQSYYKFVRTSLEYKVQGMIENVPNALAGSSEQKVPFNSSIVVYDTVHEQDYVEQHILEEFPTMNGVVDVTDEEIGRTIGGMLMDFNKGDFEVEKPQVEYMLKQLKTAEFINNHKLSLTQTIE